MAKPLLTPDRQAELLRRYPTEGNQELALAFGLTVAQVGNIAFTQGVRKTRATLSALNGPKRTQGPSVMQQVHAAVKVAGAAGMTRAELMAKLPGLRVGNTMDNLATRGHLYAAGPYGATRWFEHEADALAYAASAGVAGLRRSSSLRAQASRARFPERPAPKPTQCPPVLGRSFAATEVSSRLFKDLGPGQYADATPSPWVAAITRRA